MAKRFTDTDKYKKAFMRSLPGPYKLLWDYLYHECNHAGIWHVDFEVAQIYLGKDMPVNQDQALRLFNESEERILQLSGNKWLVKPFIPFQYGTLNPENRVHASILAALEKEGASKGLARALQGPMDKDKDMDMDKDKRETPRIFTVPTLAEVQEFSDSFRLGLDAHKFHDFYSSKGWMVGRGKMKDWKAAARLAAKDWAKASENKTSVLDFH